MKYILVLLFVTLFSLSTVTPSFADYVLPYPSTMPGGVAYKLHLVWEKMMQYWYVGNFGQFEYNLKEADKYLVEAKTLFEYKQYLLGYAALEKSDNYFGKTLPYLQKASQEGKNIIDKRHTLSEAAQTHLETLTTMENNTPPIVDWQPEKTTSSQLDIHTAIATSIGMRKKYL